MCVCIYFHQFAAYFCYFITLFMVFCCIGMYNSQIYLILLLFSGFLFYPEF